MAVTPHDPSSPVCTMATVPACAGMRNFRILETQWGEAAWCGEILDLPERFENGEIAVPTGLGFGVQSNDSVAKAHSH